MTDSTPATAATWEPGWLDVILQEVVDELEARPEHLRPVLLVCRQHGRPSCCIPYRGI